MKKRTKVLFSSIGIVATTGAIVAPIISTNEQAKIKNSVNQNIQSLDSNTETNNINEITNENLDSNNNQISLLSDDESIDENILNSKQSRIDPRGGVFRDDTTYYSTDDWPGSAIWSTWMGPTEISFSDNNLWYYYNTFNQPGLPAYDYVYKLKNGINPDEITEDWLSHFFWYTKKIPGVQYSNSTGSNSSSAARNGNVWYANLQFVLNTYSNIGSWPDFNNYQPLFEITDLQKDLDHGKITFGVRIVRGLFGDAGWYVSPSYKHHRGDSSDYGVDRPQYFTISGINFKDDTIVNDSITLDGDKWNNTVPQSIASPRNLYSDDLKQEILNRSGIVQPTGSEYRPISSSDFDLVIDDQQPNFESVDSATSGYNNSNGWAVAQLTFHPGTFYINNKLNTSPVTKYIKIFGLMQLPETQIKSGFSNNDYNANNPIADTKNNTSSSKTFASSMSVEKVQQLFYDQVLTPETFFTNTINFNQNVQNINNWMHPSTIVVNKVTPNDDNGTVAVDASLFGYENWRQYLYGESTKWNFKFTLSGYYAKSNPSDSKYFTTTITPSITINDFNQTLAENAISNNALTSDAKDKILNYIASNYSSIFSYLNPDASPIQKGDIDIWLSSQTPNFNNLAGTINIDVQLKNNKAWTNGVVEQAKIFKNVTINGFKQQQPTGSILTTTLNNPSVSDQFTNSFSYDDAVNFLNEPQNISKIYQNLPPDAKILVDRDSFDNTSDITNGTIHLKVNCSSYYSTGDSHYVNNNPPNDWVDFTITGFKNSSDDANAFTTTLNSGTLSGVNTVLPQFANDSKNHSTDNTNVINAIKNYLINGNIQNLPPETTSIAPSDLNVNITSFNNLNGTVTADVTLLNNKGWVSGQKQNITKTLTFSGLKQVKESTFNYDNKEITIQSPDNQKFATQFTLEDAQNYVDQHKNELWSNLPDGAVMFVKDIDYSQVAEGKVTFKTDTSLYYDWQGVLQQNTFDTAGYHTLTINGFKNDSQALTTSVSGVVPIKGMDQVLAQDATNTTYWDGIKSQVISALSSGNYVQNLTNGANVNQLNSSNTDLHCNPSAVAEDKQIIGSDIFWDNSAGTITVRLVISNNLAWKDGVAQQEMSFPLKITGFKKVQPTTQKNTTINVGQYNGVDWSKKLATDFSSNINGFINANKDQIYNSLPSGATLTVEGSPVIVNKDGTITVSVNTNQYYSSTDGTKYINSKMSSPITVKITGFNNIGNDGSIFTTQVNGTKLNNVDSILPDYLTNNLENISTQQKQQYLDQINQAIVDSGCVVNLAQGQTLKPTDIELTNIIANNKEGSITATVKIKNGVAQTNGDSNPNFEQTAVKFTGFKTMQPTSSITSAGVLLPNSTSTLPYDANQEQIQDYLNQHKDQVFNNLPPNATITVSSLNKSDPSLSEKGQVSVSVSVSPTYDENGNLTNNALSNEVTINGFKPSAGVNTIIANKNITIGGLNNKKADDVVKSQDNDVKQAIINYLANNENIFSNLVTGVDLTPSDITIGQLTNPVNVDGTLVVNDVTINNNKAFVNGLPSPSVNLGSITVGGFEKQNPSTWLNTNENPFQFNEFKDIKITDITNEKLQPILQSHINQILSNAPANATLSVNIDQGSIDIAKGTLRATVSTSSYYDNQGNLQTDNHSQVYTFGFFIKDTNSTSIGGVSLGSPYNAQVASETISGDTTNLANDIKQQIINNNLINNSYPLAGPIGDKFKVEIVPNSANNLNGTVQAKVTLDDGYYMENGVVITPSKPITITVDGFKKLTPTNVDPSTINNAINKKTNVNEIVNNPQTVSDIQNAVSNALTDSMFPNNKPAADQIKVTTSNLNPANGSFDVNVEIPGEYVDSDGNIQPGPFKKTITVNGCKSDTSTTSVAGGALQNCNTIIATELNASTSSEVKNQIKQAMLDANLIKNTTSGKTFTTDNFDIQFVDGTANNLDGSISVNVTINSGYACEGGNQINQPKVWSNIKLTGFEVLKPTTINNDAVNNVIDKNLNPNQIASNSDQINKIKDAVNNALTNDMFPNGNKPSADQIKVEITNQNPADGSFNIHVTIPGPTVNSDGTINNNGTQIDIPVSGCKTDTNTTSAVNGTISGCENIIASQITSNDYSKIIDGIIANGNIIVQTSSNKDQPISASDIEISVDPSTANNLDGSVQVTITVKNGYASKNGVIQNDPVTLAPVKITGFKILTPTDINANNIKVDSNSNANQFENNPNAMNDIANQVANNLNPNMFPDGNKPTADKIHAEIVNTDPANGTVDVKVTVDVPQYVDKNGNIQNGPFEQTVTIKGFKKDTTTTSVLGSKNLSGLENLIPSDVNNQNQDAINQIKQAIVDDYNNNKNSTNPDDAPILQNLNTGKPNDLTVNDIDVSIVNGQGNGNDNLNGSIKVNITVKNDYACENGKPLPSKVFGPVTIGGLKQLTPTVIGEVPSPIGDQTSAKDLANSGQLGNAVADGIINNTDPSMFPNGPLQPSQITVGQPTNIDNVHGTIQVPVEINAPWVDDNGNIRNIDGNDPFRTTVTLVGLKNIPEQSWLDNNWWIILVAVAGACLLLLILLLIVKKAKERNSLLYGY